MLKKYLKSYGFLLISIITLTIFISILNSLFAKNFTIIKLIIPAISMLIASFFLGKSCKEKAYLEGLKFSAIYLIIITIIKLLLKTNFNYQTMIMYFLLVFTSIIGSMIGINLKKE